MYKVICHRLSDRQKQVSGPMSLIGALIGKEGILVFSDRRMITNPERGIFKDGIEKIHPMLSTKNFILSSGDAGVFDSLYPLIQMAEFDQAEIDNIASSGNAKYWQLCGGILALHYNYISKYSCYILVAGFDKQGTPKIIKFETDDTAFRGSDMTAQGFYVFSSVPDISAKFITELYKSNLSFTELEEIAKTTYNYMTNLSAFIGGGCEIKSLIFE